MNNFLFFPDRVISAKESCTTIHVCGCISRHFRHLAADSIIADIVKEHLVLISAYEMSLVIPWQTLARAYLVMKCP